VFNIRSNTKLYTFKHKDEINSIQLSRNASRALTSSDDSLVRWWSWESGAPVILTEVSYQDERVFCARLFRDEERAVSCTYEGHVQIFSLISGQVLARLEEIHNAVLMTVHISPDEMKIAVASWNHTARVYELSSASQENGFVLNFPDEMNAICFSFDSCLVAVAGDDATPRIFNASSGQPVCSCSKMNDDKIVAIAFAPTSNARLISCCWDETAALWDVRTGHLLCWLTGHSDKVSSVCFFSPTRCITASFDGTARMFDLVADARRVFLQWLWWSTSRAIPSSDSAFQRLPVEIIRKVYNILV